MDNRIETFDFCVIPTEEKLHGLPMLCIKKTGVGIMPGDWGFCHSVEWFNINGVKYWQPYHIYLISKEEIEDIRDGEYFTMHGKIFKSHECFGSSDCKKVVASTDKSLGLPMVPYILAQSLTIAMSKYGIAPTVCLEMEFDDSRWDDEVGTKYGVYFRPKTDEFKCVKYVIDVIEDEASDIIEDDLPF